MQRIRCMSSSNDLAAQSQLTVHPIVHFARHGRHHRRRRGTGRRSRSNMLADDDRQLFAPSYTGQVMLSYTDSGGTAPIGSSLGRGKGSSRSRA